MVRRTINNDVRYCALNLPHNNLPSPRLKHKCHMLHASNLFNFFATHLVAFLPLSNSYFKNFDIKLSEYYISKVGYFLFFLRFLSNLYEHQIKLNRNVVLSNISSHKNIGKNIQQNKIVFKIESKIEIEKKNLNLLSNYLALPKHFLSPLAILIGQINRKSILFQTTKKQNQFYFTQTQNTLFKKSHAKIFKNLSAI